MYRRNGPTIAFFSAARYQVCGDEDVTNLVHEVTGEKVKANFIGSDLDGYPVGVNGSGLFRPTHYESYLAVGEIGTGALKIVVSEEEKERARAGLRDYLLQPWRRLLYSRLGPPQSLKR